ncbi:hypothetical protein FNU76_05720 [Chitinimonas arctica]|uniref:Uncharacterized protein n=1 Tax=Chitinimonas arctica TaxID=2594795 RepID=A0A516SCV7_9NEIS|nr:hypothetical protein [Chitinimonas arctica]QDQ25888.1 hypothetical protein FNU76_05720 [Chitinimonas arctica]
MNFIYYCFSSCFSSRKIEAPTQTSTLIRGPSYSINNPEQSPKGESKELSNQQTSISKRFWSFLQKFNFASRKPASTQHNGSIQNNIPIIEHNSLITHLTPTSPNPTPPESKLVTVRNEPNTVFVPQANSLGISHSVPKKVSDFLLEILLHCKKCAQEQFGTVTEIEYRGLKFYRERFGFKSTNRLVPIDTPAVSLESLSLSSIYIEWSRNPEFSILAQYEKEGSYVNFMLTPSNKLAIALEGAPSPPQRKTAVLAPGDASEIVKLPIGNNPSNHRDVPSVLVKFTKETISEVNKCRPEDFSQIEMIRVDEIDFKRTKHDTTTEGWITSENYHFTPVDTSASAYAALTLKGICVSVTKTNALVTVTASQDNTRVSLRMKSGKLLIVE